MMNVNHRENDIPVYINTKSDNTTKITKHVHQPIAYKWATNSSNANMSDWAKIEYKIVLKQ